MHPARLLAARASICALLSAPLAAACAAAPAAPAPSAAVGAQATSICPARLPAHIDPAQWEGFNLERGSNTPVTEVKWAADAPHGPAGSVECHYNASDPWYERSHPYLRSVFKAGRPDPTLTPAWHPMLIVGSDRYLCSPATEAVFDVRDCPFTPLGRLSSRPGETALPF
jgi:hypothetical protein